MVKIYIDFTYFLSALGETSVAPVYDYVFSTIVNSIPNPPTPSQLMGKGIILGKRLINSTKYQLVRAFELLS